MGNEERKVNWNNLLAWSGTAASWAAD